VSLREWHDSVQDILNAIAEIRSFTDGMDYEQFRLDNKSIRAGEMNFIIIGEAANQVPDQIVDQYPEILW
jgi:uncharacterized protein with HEPN domain